VVITFVPTHSLGHGEGSVSVKSLQEKRAVEVHDE
jgi:hypothetical protein